MATLFPHLARSIQMHLLLAGSRRAQTLAQVALDQMKLGIILLDSANRVCYLNRSAEALLGLPWGPRIVDRCLIFPTSGQTAVFRKLAAGTIATAQGKGMDPGGRLRCSLPGVPGAGLEFVVTPVPQEASMIEAGGEQACAVVFLSHHGRAPVPWAPLVHTFGLTPAQARLAAHLAGGESLEESARLLEISIHTARTQIKVIFAKTGTRRQGELVALLMRGMLTGLQNKEFNAPG